MTDIAGIANTNALVDHTIHNHAAATAARNYNSGTPPKGTSAWFLPSAGQWYKMIDVAGGYTNLRDGFSSIGGTNLQKRDYWSSTERAIDFAHEIDFNNGVWGSIEKTPSGGYNVRACLAF